VYAGQANSRAYQQPAENKLISLPEQVSKLFNSGFAKNNATSIYQVGIDIYSITQTKQKKLLTTGRLLILIGLL
jgi:hypothetical protein